MWWRGVSLVMAIAAVLGVFVEIPIISAYAFWILVAAFMAILRVASSRAEPHFRAERGISDTRNPTCEIVRGRSLSRLKFADFRDDAGAD